MRHIIKYNNKCGVLHMKKNKTANKIRKKVNKSLPNKQKEGMGVLKSVLLGLCVYLVCVVAVSFALSAFLLTLPDPNSFVSAGSMISAVIAALVSSVSVRKLSEMPPLLSGILSAVSVAVLTFAFSYVPLMNRQDTTSFGKAVLFGVLIIASIVGAYIGGKKQTKTRRSLH